MPSLDDRPTLSDVRSWRDTLNGRWSDFVSDIEIEEDVYFQRFDILAPHGKFGAKTGSAPSDVDAAVDSIVPTDILVRVRPARNREKYRLQADKLARAGRALLFAWRRKKDVVRQIITDMVIRRCGVGRVLFDRRMWPSPPEELSEEERAEWEERHRRVCPIILERRDPRFVRWQDLPDGSMAVVVEHYPTTALEAKVVFSSYPAAERILRGRQAEDIVWVSDVWYGAYRCILINDEPVFPVGSGAYKGIVPHGYDEIPYIVAPFRELPFEEPHLRYRGMLTASRELYQMESQVLSMQVWMLAWNAWRTYIGWTVDGRDIEILPGRMIPIDQRKGEYLQLIQGQSVPPEVLQTAAVIDAYIQRNAAAAGPRSAEGTRSGQQLWAIQSMRQMKLEAARQSATAMIERALYFAMMIAERNVKETITLPVPGRDRDGRDLGEVSFGPDDIAGYWDGFDVSLGRRLDPALIEQAKALAVLSSSLRWMPLRVSWELSGLSDMPSEWRDELLLEAVDNLPFMLEAAALEQLRKYYGEDHELYKLFVQKVAESKTPQQPAAGAPGVPVRGGLQPPSARGGPASMPVRGGGATRPPSPAGRTRGPRMPGGTAPPVTSSSPESMPM